MPLANSAQNDSGLSASPSESMGIGFIGCGNISETYLALLPLFRGVHAVACADLDADLATQRASEFNIKAQSVQELLANPDVQLVVNLTVPAVHAQVTLSCLNAGKHVYSEKPLGLGLKEVRQIRDVAAERNVRVGCAPDTWFGGAHQQARQIVDSGQIGRINHGTCHVMGHGMEGWHPNPDFFFQPGAGPILDIGPYYIANLINMIGPVKTVFSMASIPESTRTIGNGDRLGQTIPVNTPTTIHATLEFHSGAIVSFVASWDVWAHEHNNMELYGSKGSLFVPDPNFFAGDVRMALSQDGEPGEVENLPALEHPFNVLNEEKEDEEPRANYRGAGLADMAQAIAHNRAHRCSLEGALHSVDVMVSILESAESGQRVWVSSTCERPALLTEADARSLLAGDSTA